MNGCPWDEDTCTWAADNDHKKCLQYAYENGCPIDIYNFDDLSFDII